MSNFQDSTSQSARTFADSLEQQIRSYSLNELNDIFNPNVTNNNAAQYINTFDPYVNENFSINSGDFNYNSEAEQNIIQQLDDDPRIEMEFDYNPTTSSNNNTEIESIISNLINEYNNVQQPSTSTNTETTTNNSSETSNIRRRSRASDSDTESSATTIRQNNTNKRKSKALNRRRIIERTDPVDIDSDHYDIEKNKINVRRPPSKGGYGKQKMSRSINPITLNHRQNFINGLCTDRQGRVSVCKEMINRYNFKDTVETNYLSASHICAFEITIAMLKEALLSSVEDYIGAVVKYIISRDAYNTVSSNTLGRFLNIMYFIVNEKDLYCKGRNNIINIISACYSDNDNSREEHLQHNLTSIVTKYKCRPLIKYDFLNQLKTIKMLYKFSPDINAFVPNDDPNESSKRYRIRLTGKTPTTFDKYIEHLPN